MTCSNPPAVVTEAVPRTARRSAEVLPDRLEAAAHSGTTGPGSGDRPWKADEEAR
ncbi:MULTISPECIES: hypothetical protein [unclassified Streptomyces]|jgi:hypothetical protein|uniref:hypothetical protein n=1 Tax=unclassified Streptomyces TaxID=2593676 RepID=UPI0033B7D845